MTICNKKISTYCTSRCAVEMDYPFEASIRSALSFADEIIVADSSEKDDGTMDVLQQLMNEDERIQVYHVDVDWHASNSGIYDGQMKAFAREQCTGDILVQNDIDEIFEDDWKDKLEQLLSRNLLTNDIPLMALPVIEYWGPSTEKVRIDIPPWKWRISKNIPEITHGIPVSHRWYKDNLLYSRHGDDGCSYISSKTGNPIPCLHFINQEVENIRQQAIYDQSVVPAYQAWYQAAVDSLPTIQHFSWWSIVSKIKKYKLFWNNSWLSLYGEKLGLKHPDWNPFFRNRSLNSLSDKEFEAKAKELATETGGHIFHTQWIPNQTRKTNSVKLAGHNIPEVIKLWAENHKI